MSEKAEKKPGMSTFAKIIIALLSIIIIAGIVFGVFYLKLSSNSTVKTVHPLANQSTYSLDEFKLNLAEPNEYIQTTIYIGYDMNTKLDTELASKKPVIRDTVLNVIRSKKMSDFSGKGTETLKIQIINSINPLLENGKIKNVYFDSLLIQ